MALTKQRKSSVMLLKILREMVWCTSRTLRQIYMRSAILFSATLCFSVFHDFFLGLTFPKIKNNNNNNRVWMKVKNKVWEESCEKVGNLKYSTETLRYCSKKCCLKYFLFYFSKTDQRVQNLYEKKKLYSKHRIQSGSSR